MVSFLVWQLIGCAFLGLGLWLRFSPSTRGIFQIEGLNSGAFVVGEFCKKHDSTYCSKIKSLTDVSLSLFVSGVTVLIVLGAVMLIVVTFGDYGACSEKRHALQVVRCFFLFLHSDF